MINTYTIKKLDFTFDVTIDELKECFSIILLKRYVEFRSQRIY